MATTNRDVAVSLCPPACRTLVVEAWMDGETVTFAEYPVIAVRSIISRQYGLPYPAGGEPPWGAGSEGELLREGWVLQHQDTHTDLIFISAGMLDGHREELDFDGIRELAAAPWPPEEDDARLGELKAGLAMRVRQRHEQNRKRREALRANQEP